MRPDPRSCLGSQLTGQRCRQCFQRQGPGRGRGEGRASGGASSRWGCSYCRMSPLQEPRNPEPQSPPCTGLHLSTAPALALGGHPCSLGSTARTAGQDRDSLLAARDAHTHSHPASSCKAETGQEAWNPQLSRWPECNMPLPNQTWKMHSLHKAASVSASQQAQPSP